MTNSLEEMEPGVRGYGTTSADQALASIAISLKRIADALTADPRDSMLAQAIVAAISDGAQNWIGYMARSGR